MANQLSETERLDAVSRLTNDIQPADPKVLERLRGLASSAIAAMPAPQVSGAIARAVGLGVTEQARKTIGAIKLSDAGGDAAPVAFVRSDSRETLLGAQIAGPLTALAPAERLGPFTVDGGLVGFDFFRPATHYQLKVSGTAAPAVVFTAARTPRLPGPGALTLDLHKGTVWVRGDLVGGGMPAGAYVGLMISGGKAELPHAVSVGTDAAEVAAPFAAKLILKLATEAVTATPDGCRAKAKIELPELTLTFGPAGLKIDGTAGKASAWDQTFAFSAPTGTIDFIAPLWTLLIGYKFAPDGFAGDAISSALADFRGHAQVTKAALTLPVVLAGPSVLSAAAVGPGWALKLQGLEARWSEPDNRFHGFDPWLGIGTAGTLIFAPKVQPLAVPVDAVYRLWEAAEAPGKRLPWRHRYDADFLFYYACHVANGETLVATGTAEVRLDRPLETRNRPVRTPTTAAVVSLHKGAGPVQATLGALIGDSDKTQFALRNALLWTTRAAAIIAQGPLTARQFIDSGTTFVYFGVFGWAPTLPDPYVGNFRICLPDADTPHAIMAARVSWTVPDAVVTAFVGDIGAPLVCERPASPFKPVPAPKSRGNPGLGPTQTDQDAVHLSEKALAAWRAAQERELGTRGRRVEQAQAQNTRAEGHLQGYVDKLLGRTPPVLLLDVSTNQDLLGVALWGGLRRPGAANPFSVAAPDRGSVTDFAHFPLEDLDVRSPVEALRLVTLPQIQWEPVRTLDADQDVITLGWFPTPLASATDGGATVLGSRYQKLVPVVPDSVVAGTLDAFGDGKDVIFRTTLPFGIVTVVEVTPKETPGRKSDHYELTRPEFPTVVSTGGIQITAKAEGDRDSAGGISPLFSGITRQLLNGVDLATGAPLGISVLGSTLAPSGSTEAIFNHDMTARPRVPVTRFDLSGYGGSNFSRWENPFALFAETSKTQFQVMGGRTALEIIKVASVLHPWGIRVTREVIVERQSGGGVIRRDTGWQAASPGIFDYRYTDTSVSPAVPAIAPYAFDAGIIKGLFNVSRIRPAPGTEFSHGTDSFVPYYFDAELALDGLAERTPAVGVLGWLQTRRNGAPAAVDALAALIDAQGPVGGPLDAMIPFGASTLPFRAQRIEVGLADDGGTPLFVATVRGTPKFPKNGAWSMVKRPVVSVLPGGGEAAPVADSRGAPIVRRYPVEFDAADTAAYDAPRLRPGAAVGDWRIADAEDLLKPSAPANDYCVLQSTPTHAFLFPRCFAQGSGPARLRSALKPELADVIARSTSKGAFPPPENVIQLGSIYHFDVGGGGTLALSAPIFVVGYPTPLRLSGSTGHGSQMLYDQATLSLQINADNWSAEFTGLRIWSDIAGLERASGASLRVVGSTTQRPQVTDINSLVHHTIDEILTFLPIFGARGPLGPIDLGASNAKHEIKIEVTVQEDVPKGGWSIGGASLKLTLGVTSKTGFDLATGGAKASASIDAGFKGEFPILSVAAASVYIITKLDVTFSLTSVSGSVTAESFDLLAFAGIGVKGQVGPFQAYAFLGVGFVLSYDIPTSTVKYGGLVQFEAGIKIVVVNVKLTAELKGLVYKDSAVTKCDYSGSVKLHVDIFLIISINASYSVSDTKSLE